MSEDLELFIEDNPNIQAESTNAHISNTTQVVIDDVPEHRRAKANKLRKYSKNNSPTLESRLSRSMGGTAEPICLSWRNVNVFVKTGQNKCCARGNSNLKLKQILRNGEAFRRVACWIQAA